MVELFAYEMQEYSQLLLCAVYGVLFIVLRVPLRKRKIHIYNTNSIYIAPYMTRPIPPKTQWFQHDLKI